MTPPHHSLNSLLLLSLLAAALLPPVYAYIAPPLPRRTHTRNRNVAIMMAVTRKPRPVPPPADENSLAIRVCTDPKKSCGARGGEDTLQLMRDVAEGAGVQVISTACVGPCSLGVNVVAGWVDGRKKFQRAGVERDPDDPAGQTSKSALRKNKPGVYNKVQTRGDCEVVLSKLQEKASAALAPGGGEAP